MFRVFHLIMFGIFVVAVPAMSVAQDARHCIVVEPAYAPLADQEMMSINNTCPDDVYVHWCHEGNGDGACGGERYFKNNRILESGERVFNRYSLPTGPAIRVAACFGRSPAAMYLADNPGGYGCVVQEPTVSCPGGKQKSFTWEAKYANGSYTFVRVISGDLISWIRLENEAYEILKEKRRAVEDPVANRLCGDVDQESLSSKVVNTLKDEVRKFFDKRRAACLADATAHSNCDVYRNPSQPLMTAIGTRG